MAKLPRLKLSDLPDFSYGGSLKENQNYSDSSKYPVDRSLTYGSARPSVDINVNRQANAQAASEYVGKTISPAQSRFANIPEDTKFQGGYGTVQPSEIARYASLKDGQYTTDPKQIGKLIKSERIYESDENAFLRGGLPSYLFQIDHVIPIWAGGSDTLSNKQLLSTKDHNKKTKVGAIARTLYYDYENSNGKEGISINEARRYTLDWRDKNVEGIHLTVSDEQGKGGKIIAENPSELAAKKIKEWDEKPGKVTFKSVIKEIPDAIETVASKFVPPITYDFGKGVLKQLTLGWVDPGETDYSKWKMASDFEKKVGPYAEGAGEIAGGITSFVALGAALKGLGTVTGFSKMAQGSKTVQKLSPLLSKAGSGVRKKGVSVGGEKALKVLGNSGLFALHGQLSKQESNDLKSRGKRLMSDVAMGSLLGVAGHSIKGIAGVGIGTYVISDLEGATEEESFINAVTMMGLHGLGYSKYRKKLKLDKKRVNSLANEIAFRKRWGMLNPGEPPLPKGGRIISKHFTKKRIELENKQIANNLTDQAIRGEISAREQGRELKKALVAGRQLWKGGLGKKARLYEEIRDIFSVGDKLKKKGYDSSNRGMPRNQVNYLDKNLDKNGSLKQVNGNIKELDGTEIIGQGQITLIGTKNDKKIINFIDKIQRGQASSDILLVKEPGLKGNLEIQNSRMSEKDIAAGLQKPYANPEKNIGIWGAGEGYESIGFIPRPYKIKGASNSYTNRALQFKEELKRQGKDPNTIKMPDENINKNSIFDKMGEKGYEVIGARIKVVKKSGAGLGDVKGSGRPSIIIEINKQHWADAKIRNEGLRNLDSIDYRTARDKIKDKVAIIPSKAIENTKVEGIADEVAFDSTKKQLVNLISKIEKEIAYGSPKSLKKVIDYEIGDILSVKEFQKYFDIKGKKVKNLINDIGRGLDPKSSKASNINQRGKEFVDALVFVKNDVSFSKTWNSILDLPLGTPQAKYKAPKVKTGEIKQEIKLEKKPADIKVNDVAVANAKVANKVMAKKKPIDSSDKGFAKLAKDRDIKNRKILVKKGRQTTLQEQIANRPKVTPKDLPVLKRVERTNRMIREENNPKLKEFNSINDKVKREFDEIKPAGPGQYEKDFSVKEKMLRIIDDRVNSSKVLDNVWKKKLKENLEAYTDEFMKGIGGVTEVKTEKVPQPKGKDKEYEHLAEFERPFLKELSKGKELNTRMINAIRELQKKPPIPKNVLDQNTLAIQIEKSKVKIGGKNRTLYDDLIKELDRLSGKKWRSKELEWKFKPWVNRGELNLPQLAKTVSDLPRGDATRGLMEGQLKEIVKIADQIKLGKRKGLPKEVTDYINKNYKPGEIPGDVYPGSKLFDLIQQKVWKDVRKILPEVDKEGFKAKSVVEVSEGKTAPMKALDVVPGGGVVLAEDVNKVPFSDLQWIFSPLERAGGLKKLNDKQIKAIANNLARTLWRYLK